METKELPIYQVDAFTPRLFAGNPAAVVLLEDWLSEGTMLSIAAENNLSETAFVIPGEGVCELRWFTPATEMELCGHATLAAAHVLLSEFYPAREVVRFNAVSGPLSVRRDGERLTMDFPSRPGVPVEVTGEMTAALGARPEEALRASYLLAVFGDQEMVERLDPDLTLVSELDATAVIVTAPGRECDFVSRFFAPSLGIPEDPVTGSAHCTLVPYWSRRLGLRRLNARQLSRRGGELMCELKGGRVEMSGCAVTYMKGVIRVPES